MEDSSESMQTCLKISFWFSVFMTILASGLGCMAGNYFPWYLAVVIFALPGIFVKTRLYKIASLFIFCAWLIFAYQDREAGKRRQTWMPQLEKIQEEKSEKP